MPMLTKMVGVLISHEPRIVIVLDMLQIPKCQQSQGFGMSPTTQIRGGGGKDLNELTRKVTVIEGRQPPTVGRRPEWFQ